MARKRKKAQTTEQVPEANQPKAKKLKAKQPKAKQPVAEEDSGSEGWEEVGLVGDDAAPAPAKKAAKLGKEVAGESLKVFVGGLPWSTTEKQLREHFGQHGQLKEVEMPAKTAFITLESPADMEK